MKIIEVTTSNGRVFRVAIENDRQMEKFTKTLKKNKKKNYETFVSVVEVDKDIHSIKEFEAIAEGLV